MSFLPRSQVFRYLKTHGKSTITQITTGILRSPEEISDMLDIEVAGGYISEDTTTHPYQYEIKIILGPLTKKEEIIPLWRHKEILQRVDVPEKASVIPPALIKAVLEALIWWQGGRGSCVGFAGAVYKWRMYIEATGHIPTIEQIKAACQIIEEDIGCTAGKFKYMTLPDGFWSPQWIYDRSRKYGNCTYPAGSDTTWAAKIIANEGAVPWNECLTSITGLCAPELWIGFNATYEEALAKLAPIAAEHKNKFAASNDFNEVYNAVKNGRAVFGPVNLPPDFLNPAGGRWLSYGGGSAGGHAVPAVLVDEAEHLIITRGSWDGDGGETWYSFDERFFNENAGPFLIGLNQEEAKIGESLYTSCNIVSNVPAMISVNGVNIGISPQKIALEKGKTYIINASADGYITQSRTVNEGVKELILTLEALPAPKPKSWWTLLVEFLMRIFKR